MTLVIMSSNEWYHIIPHAALYILPDPYFLHSSAFNLSFLVYSPFLTRFLPCLSFSISSFGIFSHPLPCTVSPSLPCFLSPFFLFISSYLILLLSCLFSRLLSFPCRSFPPSLFCIILAISSSYSFPWSHLSYFLSFQLFCFLSSFRLFSLLIQFRRLPSPRIPFLFFSPSSVILLNTSPSLFLCVVSPIFSPKRDRGEPLYCKFTKKSFCKNIENLLRFDRIMAISLWPGFSGTPCSQLN